MEPCRKEGTGKSYFRGMNLREKAEHIAAYYKTHIFLLLLILSAVIFGIYYVYRTQVDISSQCSFCKRAGRGSEALENNFKEFINDDSSMHEIL